MNNLYIYQSIFYIPIVVTIVIIGGLALIRRGSRGALFFGVMSFAIAIWLGLQGLAQLNLSDSANLQLIRLSAASSLFIGYFYLLFVRDYVGRNTTLRGRILLVLPCIFFAIINLTALGVVSVAVSAQGITINDAGVLYFGGIAILAIYLIYGLVALIIDTVRLPKAQRTANYFIFFGFGQAVVITILANLFLTGNATLQFVIPISILILDIAFAFAIIRHKLFDIRLVAARAITYSLTVLILGLLYGFVAFTFIGSIFGGINGTAKQVIDTILAVILAFTFQPIRRFFERITTNIFYRDHYDSQELINEVGRILASEIDLDKVSNRVLHEITKQIKIDKGEIVVFGEKQLFYENNVFKNGGAEISSKELRKLGRLMVVADDLKSGERKDLLQKYGVSISLSLRTSEKFIGYMLLGEKKSGDIYNDEDLKVLKTIANEVSIAMANALSYKEIQLFSETLAEKVRQRTAQLHRANDQLRDLDKAKDEFISMASHQLRTPLTTVKGYASMLEEGDFGKLTKSQQEKVDLTLDGANRMARLIDDLLNVSRMDANRFFLEVTPVDLNKLVEQEVGQLQTMAAGKNVKLTYTPPREKIPNIRLDETKTRQVVMNLVDNAIHYSKPEGGEVEVHMVHAGDSVIFEVHDNGIGVPVDAQHKLFTKMFRANNAKDVRPDGTGLGLYLVKRVVQDEGGQIVFESQEGKGSTFGFKIPLSGVPKEVEAASKKIGARVAASHK